MKQSEEPPMIILEVYEVFLSSTNIIETFLSQPRQASPSEVSMNLGCRI